MEFLRKIKISSVIKFLILSAILFFLFSKIVYAQERAECCRLKRDITIRNLTYAGSSADCLYKDGITTLSKGIVIGPGDCANSGIEPDTCFLKEAPEQIDVETTEWGTVCLIESIYSVTDWIFYISLAVAGFLGIVVGKMFAASIGNPERLNKAKTVLMFLVGGLLVGALSKSIPIMVRAVVGF